MARGDANRYLSVGGRFEYVPIIDRPGLGFPEDNHLALWIGVNVECWDKDTVRGGVHAAAPYMPDPMNQSWREYGPRVGIWRLMEGFDSLGIRASVLLNSDVCEVYPRIIEEGNKRDWIWLAHGQTQRQQGEFGELGVNAEREYLSTMVADIKLGTGKQPRGWLGPGLSETYATPDLLAELGITYVCDWCNDDLPHRMKVASGDMLAMPYAVELNDHSLYLDRHLPGQAMEDTIKDQFEVLYSEGLKSGARVMCLAIHPFITGVPAYFGHFMNALRYILGHDHVWNTTSDEIADWFYQTERG